MRTRSVKIVSLFCAVAIAACADGGKLLLRQQTGPLIVSVFSSPDTLRVGPADISVMVQKSSDKSSVLNATVKVHLSHTTAGDISEVFAPATHKNATNKLLYAAHVNLPVAGSWKLAADIESSAGSSEIASASQCPATTASVSSLLALLCDPAAHSDPVCLESMVEAAAGQESANTAIAALRPFIAITLPPG